MRGMCRVYEYPVYLRACLHRLRESYCAATALLNRAPQVFSIYLASADAASHGLRPHNVRGCSPAVLRASGFMFRRLIVDCGHVTRDLLRAPAAWPLRIDAVVRDSRRPSIASSSLSILSQHCIWTLHPARPIQLRSPAEPARPLTPPLLYVHAARPLLLNPPRPFTTLPASILESTKV